MSKFVCIISLLVGAGMHLLIAQRAPMELDSLIVSGLNREEKRPQEVGATPDASWLFTVTSEYSSEPSIAIQEWLKKHHKTDFGLRLTATANRHFGQGFNQEVDNFDQYRISLGVEWSLYEKGWFYHRTQSLIHGNETQLLQLNQANHEAQRAYGTQYNAIIYLFSQEKVNYLKSFAPLLAHSLPLYQQLYLQHLMPYHEVLELKRRIEKMDLIIDDYEAFSFEFEKNYGKHWQTKSSASLAVLNLSINDLLQNDPIQDRQLMIRDLENDNIRLKNRTKSDIRVSLYARKNFASGQSPGLNGDYNTLGAKVSVPLRSLYSYHKNLSQLEVKENNQRHQMAFQEKKKELMVAYYEYEYRLQQYLDLYYKKLHLAEKLRQQMVRTHLDSSTVSVIRSFTIFQEFVDVGYEMIGLRQLLYLNLLQIQKKLPEYSITEYCKPLTFKKERKLKGNRIFLVTTEDIQALGVDFITNYLINNEAFRLLAIGLNPSEANTLQDRGLEFIEHLPDQTLPIKVSDFNDRLDIESYIEKNAEINTTIVFDSIKQMVQLEMKNLNGI